MLNLTKKGILRHALCLVAALCLTLGAFPAMARGDAFTVTAYAEDPAAPGTPDPAVPGTPDPAEPEEADPGEEEDDAFIGGAMIDEVFGTGGLGGDSSVFNPVSTLEDSINSIILVLEGDEDTEGLMDKPLYHAFQGIAIIIMIIGALTSFISSEMMSPQFGRPTMEVYLRPMAKMIIAMIFILNVWAFLKLFLYLAQWAYYLVPDDMLAGAGGTGGADIKQQVYAMVGYKPGASGMDVVKNFFATISIVLAFFVPWLVSMANSIAMIWVVHSRTLNICVRGIMAPLAMTDICSERPIRDTKAWGYIMEFCGLCFQAVVILVALIATNQVLVSFMQKIGAEIAGHPYRNLGSLVNLGLMIAAAKLAQIAVMMGTGNIAKRLFGTS